jgi:general secretion pathway protein B
MSFILDALKKSESDRQRQSGPSLFEVKVTPPRRTLPVWAVVVAALLLINVIVISWMLLRHPAAQQAATSAAAVNSSPAVAATRAAVAPPSGPAPVPSEPAANTAPPLVTPPAAQQAARLPGQTQPPAPAGAPAGASAPAAAPAGGGAEQSASHAAPGGEPSDTAPAVEPSAEQGSGVSQGAGGDLPLYQQIVGSAGLPDLHLDLHVFAARPQDRFVMINMHRLGEGDALPNGVQVQAIRPDGVLLSYHGTRFLLPRN